MPIRTLQDKQCLITGAGSGIGRATAVAAARAGARLFLSDINEATLQEVAGEIRAAGGSVEDAAVVDVARYEDVRQYADRLQAGFGAMDVLMNIAGIATWGEIQHLEHRHWQRVIDVNLMGPIHVLECFVPRMIEAQRGGHIVNVSSAAGLFALPWHAAYSASKFGVRGVSEVLRQDLRRYGIGVSLVCPGAVHTGLVRTIEVAGVDMEHPEAVKLKGLFVGHAIPPEKAAHAILQGILRNRYLVFTSLDIRIGYWFQRKFAWPYELVMRLMNDRFARLARVAGRKRPG